MRCLTMVDVGSGARVVLCLLAFGLAARASAQQASLVGTVLEDATERPLADAEVAIAALNRVVRSDSAGNFTIVAIPAGAYRVTVRAVGHEPLQEMVTFGATGLVERDYLLARTTTILAPVEVKGNASLDAVRLADFEERRKVGLGRFITQDVLEKADGRKLADVLTSRIPGLRSLAVGGSSTRIMVSTRGTTSMSGRGPRQCPVKVIVDGMIRDGPVDINTIEPANVAGIEYFTTSQTPPQFNGTSNSPCGTLVIWTRVR